MKKKSIKAKDTITIIPKLLLTPATFKAERVYMSD